MLQLSVCELLWSLFLPVVVKVVNSHFNLNSKLKFWLHIGDIPIQIVGLQSLWRGGGRKAAHHELSRDQGRDWWGIVRPTLSVRHVCSVGLSSLQSSSSTLKLFYKNHNIANMSWYSSQHKIWTRQKLPWKIWLTEE